MTAARGLRLTKEAAVERYSWLHGRAAAESCSVGRPGVTLQSRGEFEWKLALQELEARKFSDTGTQHEGSLV